MYRPIRVIHLIAGLLMAPVLFMYALSAIQMGHRSWFRLKPAVETERLSAPVDCSDARRLAASLMSAHRWRGELTSVRKTPAGCTIEIATIGTTREARYDVQSGALVVRTSRLPAMGMLNRMHHAAGLWHPSGAMKLWAAVVALASIAVIALVVTGIWLWLLRKRERTLGLILVVANVAFSVVVLILLRTA